MHVFVIGDAPPEVRPTGFATVLHHLFSETTVTWYAFGFVGQRYTGQHRLIGTQHKKFSDVYGIESVNDVITESNPDIIFILFDSWITAAYIEEIKKKHEDIPIIAYMPADGLNWNPAWIRQINRCNHVFFYTEWGKRTFEDAGFFASSSVLPHGVDSDFWGIVPYARQQLHPLITEDLFIVGNVNTNSPRKHIDLTLAVFKGFISTLQKKGEPTDHIRLFLHCIGQGVHIDQLAVFYGIDKHLMQYAKNLSFEKAPSSSVVRLIYNTFDVQITTCDGGGWELTQAEGMACGVPQIVPDFSCFASDGGWTAKGVEHVRVHTPLVRPHNTIGAIPDMSEYIDKLCTLYYNKEYRKQLGDEAYTFMREEQFDWRQIRNTFFTTLEKYNGRN